MKPETLAIHAGNFPDDTNHPAIQSLTLATTFSRNEPGPHQFQYARASNPNRAALESVLAKLENGVDAAAFSSGNAACMTVFQALPVGSHVIVPEDMYNGLKMQILSLYNGILDFTFADLTDIESFRNIIRTETKLVWIETPSNPMLQICDIETLCAIAKEKNITVVCDNTFATPVFQQPLALGADIVMHSSTKFLGGHSDVLGGALITKKKDAFWERIRDIQIVGGAVPSPFDCYLLTRSIKTLYYRMRGHVENAQKLAEFLESHPNVEKVLYPGLPSNKGHLMAKKQMGGFGSILSFLVKGNAEQADRVVLQLKYFTHATSLGGVESLIERRASVESPDTKTPQNLLRVSVGLEHIDDLIDDLAQALSKI
jgi:cystathionine gamma-synthase